MTLPSHPTRRLLLAALLASMLAAPAVAAESALPLVGTVHDPEGRVIAGVEVLLVRLPSRTLEPTATVETDARGRFEVASLLPGAYRVAALKSGYRTFVGRLDTLVQDSLDLVLRPAETAAHDEGRPSDPAWALRLPRRGVLNDLGASPVNEPAGVPRAAEGPRVEIEQLLSFSPESRSDAATNEGGPEPSETRMQLASLLGSRGSIEVRGRRERETATNGPGSADASASRTGALAAVAASYLPTRDDRVGLTAFYGEADYRLATPSAGASGDLEQARQTQGLDARWSRRIDPTRQLEVALDLVDASFVREDGAAPGVSPAPTAELASRNGVAETSYSSVLRAGHDLELRLRAEYVDGPPVVEPGVPATGASRTRYRVAAGAKDTWALSAPVSLIYGLGYRRVAVDRDAALVVPEVGAAFGSGAWFLRGTASYHATTGNEWSEAGRSLRPPGRVGFRAEAEVPLWNELKLRGATSYSPLDGAVLGYADGATPARPSHPLYMTDGGAALEDHRLALVLDVGGAQAFFEVEHGRAEGAVAPLIAFDDPGGLYRDSYLLFQSGRIGFAYPGRGTDLELEYERVEAGDAGGGSERAQAIQQAVELRVKQQVSRLEIPGDWRVLLAVRLGSTESDDLRSRESYDVAESVDALDRRISAGLSVLF